MDVVLVHWPADGDALEEARRSGRPRLLLVERHVPPPMLVDDLEDWVRVPADEFDIDARVKALARRHGRSQRPVLDDDGVLRFNRSWVALPPIEARLVRALLARWGAVVSRTLLARACWPDGEPGSNTLDVHILRVRRRIEPLGLEVRNVRARGYLLAEVRP